MYYEPEEAAEPHEFEIKLLANSDRNSFTLYIDDEEGSELEETPQGWTSPAPGSPHPTLQDALNALVKYDLERWGEMEARYQAHVDNVVHEFEELEF
jgi:hypothetical protein